MTLPLSPLINSMRAVIIPSKTILCFIVVEKRRGGDAVFESKPKNELVSSSFCAFSVCKS